jgi:serine/threonine protein phosphatase PrpC
MAGRVFINYRRGDEAGFTQALYLRLEGEFTPDELFMDVEGHIRPGDDFVEILSQAVAVADVVLVVIGPRWVDLLSAHGDGHDDFVVIEIKAALDQGKRIIPVLVGSAIMPRSETLPVPIRALARRNAVGLRPERFRADCQGLITALKGQLAAAEKERAARTEAQRAAAEAERQRHEAEEAARVTAAEARTRAQSAAGLSSEEIRKLEELANWDFVKQSEETGDLRNHLARFPGGVTERYALAKVEELAWAVVAGFPTIPALRSFLEEFPRGPNASIAEAMLEDLQTQTIAKDIRTRETAAWNAVAASEDAATIKLFLAAWPDGEYARMARERLSKLSKASASRRWWRWTSASPAAGVAGFAWAGCATKGTKDIQEDVIIVCNDSLSVVENVASGAQALVVLADGMSERPCGQRASVTACQGFLRGYAKWPGRNHAQALSEGLSFANQAIHGYVQSNSACKGMGSTLLAAFLDRMGMTWVNVGDSLLLLYRFPDLIRLNVDHSLGGFLDEEARQNRITRGEARQAPNRSELRSAITGSEVALIDQQTEPLKLKVGDWVMLASDGIMSLPGDEIAEIMYHHRESSPEDMAEGLIKAILQKNLPDQGNASVLTIKVA